MFHTHNWVHTHTKIISAAPEVANRITKGVSMEDFLKLLHGYEIRILKCTKCGDEKETELVGSYAAR